MYENLYAYSPNTQKGWRQMDEKFKAKPGTPEIPTPKQAPIQLPRAPEKKKKLLRDLRGMGRETPKHKLMKTA